MDLTEMLDKLVLDLKMTLNAEISTAEGTRAIEKAVDALSRKIPRERIYEHTWIETVTDDSFVLPAATDLEKIVKDWDISAIVAGDTATLVTAWMDIPRPVKITLTDADDSITSFVLVIKGTDIDGKYREERLYRRGGKIQTGKVYFYTITEIEMNAITGNAAGDILDIGTDSGIGIWVNLDYPIDPKSEEIYSAALKAGTKYTRNTDYEMDYANGNIRIITGSTMTEGSTYYASYNKAQCSIDISSIIPELIRIVKVIYPVDKIPEQSVAFTIWDNLLTIGSPRPGVSQEALVDTEHLAIYYEARHSPPTTVGSGSYPELLDEVVLIGAGGYALEIKALQYEQQAVTDLASLRTELGLTSAVHTLAAAALAKAAVLITSGTGKIDLALAKIDTALAKIAGVSTEIDTAITKIGTVTTNIGTAVTKISAALTKVALYLETNDTTDNAKDVLANITDDIANLRTKLWVALDATVTLLGGVTTISLDKATTGAEPLLDTGISKINTLNDGGETVADKYAVYSQTRTTIGNTRIQSALGYAQEAQARLSAIQSYIVEAEAWMRMGEVFISEAQSWSAELNAFTNEANVYVGEANIRVGELNSYINEANTRVSEANAYISEASIAISEANAHIGQIDRYLNEASLYQQTAEGDMVLADRFRAEAQSRLSRFTAILDNRAEYRKRVVSVSVRQPA